MENTKNNVVKNKGNVICTILLIIFAVFTIFACIPWESLFSKFSAFTDFNVWLSKLDIFGYKIFNNVIGSPVIADATTGQSTGAISALGSWTIMDVSIFLLIISAVIVLFNRKTVKMDEYISSIIKGAKRALPVAVVAVVISLVLIAFITSGVNVTIVNWLTTLPKKLFVLSTTLGSMVGSLTTADFYYFVYTLYTLFQNSAQAVTGNSDLYGVVALSLQSIYYFVMMIAPTSVMLLVGLYSMDIPYGKWVKYIWKALLAILAVVVISIIIAYAIAVM